MSMPPLTHHEILGLIEPFTRRGRHVDLAASNRIERRLVFKPIEHRGDGPEAPSLRESLRLDHPYPGRFELMRILTVEGGLEAKLESVGEDPGALLACVERIAPQRQFVSRPGYLIAQSYYVEPVAGAYEPAEPEQRMRLMAATMRIDGLSLSLRVSRVTGVPADIEVAARPDDPIELPEDVLAVLGWPWSRLTRTRGVWVGCLRLRRREPERSRDAERKLERTAQHLASTLAETPRRFHERFFAARWRVAFRRAVPLLVCIGLIPAALAVPKLEFAENSIVRMLLFHAPPLLLLFYFALPETPRIEIPPLPRRLRPSSWRTAPLSADPGS